MQPQTASTTTTVTRKIGSNRGKARLWLEGVCLSSQGWEKGKRYTATPDGKGSLIYQSVGTDTVLHGVRKVAGTDTRPIIDTNTDDLLKFIAGVKVGDTVTVTVTPDLITVRAYNEATDGKPGAFADQRKPV
jgi:hypothetical protein